MAKPIFTNDKDLLHGADIETFFRNGGIALITGWDSIQAKNPENPFLFDRWLAVLDSQGNADHLGLIQQWVKKYPDATFSKLDYLNQCYSAENYDEGLKVGFPEVMRDDNDPDWYDLMARCLWAKQYYEETIQLLKAWTQLHPENQEAWMMLKDYYVDWAWVARGDGWADSVTKEGWRLMKERMAEAEKAATQASQLAPEDCRVWSKLLSLGNGSEFTKERMQGYFDKMFKLNPYRTQGYDVYVDYLAPKWNGSEEEVRAFAEKYDPYDPGLLASGLEELFQVYSDDKSVEGMRKRIAAMKEKMIQSGKLPEFEKSYFGYLKFHPENMGFWNDFISWEIVAGRQQIALDFAKKISRKNPELKALPPALTLAYLQLAEGWLVTDDEKYAYEEKPATVKATEGAYLDRAKLEPANWNNWNSLAFYSFEKGDMRVTRRALEAIGDHWSPEVWPKDIFAQAQTLSQKCPDCQGTGVASCGAPGCFHGTIPCPNHCLQLGEGQWVHLHVAGHPDTDLWKKFFNDDGSYTAWSQAHLGHVIKLVNGKYMDAGICPICHGTGRVECPVCHGKNVCLTCHGTGIAPKKEKGKRRKK